MKSMTCKQLGGACDEVFSAETFDEIAELSKLHGMAMFRAQDSAHTIAMHVMMQLMEDSAAMTAWFDARRKEFDELAED